MAIAMVTEILLSISISILFSSKVIGLIEAVFHIDHVLVQGKKVHSDGLGHTINLTSMHIYGELL